MTIKNLELLNALKEDLKEFVNNDEKNYEVPSGTDTGGVPCDSGNISRDYGEHSGDNEVEQ
jgi:hypothetical protein